MESGAGFEVLALFGVERGQELSVGGDGAQGAEVLAEVVAVSHGTFVVASLCFCIPDGLTGKAAEGIVGDVVFQGVAYAVVEFAFKGAVSALEVFVVVGAQGVVLAGSVGTASHGFIGQFDVKVA